jgi:ABC-type amino acid transport substrate-binding protein
MSERVGQASNRPEKIADNGPSLAFPLSLIATLSILLALINMLFGCAGSNVDPTWQRIQEQGVVRVGMDPNWVPFEYVDGVGQLTGFDVELARELERRLGLEIRIVANLSFDGLYDALTAEQADMIISAVMVDMGRSADFRYSTPYFDAGQVLVVGIDEVAIDTMKDLSGRVVAVELGSDGDMLGRRWARRLADMSLWHTESTYDALGAVAMGQADAALIDRATALMALKGAHRPTTAGMQTSDGRPARGNTELKINGRPITDEQYAVVVRRESSGLLTAVNQALLDMQSDGTLENLERKWLGP